MVNAPMMNGANWDAVEAKLTPRWVQEKVGLLDAELEGERARRETAEAQPGGRRKGGDWSANALPVDSGRTSRTRIDNRAKDRAFRSLARFSAPGLVCCARPHPR